MNQLESRIFGLDVMRAIAIGLVILAHSRFFIVNDFPILANMNLFGFYGVELFFVLSGFLIGTILLKLGNSLNTFGGLFFFWKRRWYRTLPNYYLFLLISVCVSLLLTKPLPKLWLFLPFLQNFAWQHPAFFGESWSLAVEEWFYLLLPCGLYLLAKTKHDFRRSFLLLSLLFLIGPMLLRLGYVYSADPTWDQGVRKITVLRLDAIMFGMLAAWAKQEWPALWTGFAKPLSLLGFLILLTTSWLFWRSPIDQSNFSRIWLFTIVSFGFTCLIPASDLWRVHSETPFTQVFRNLALWSYSLYLCNLSVYFLLSAWLPQDVLAMRILSSALYVMISLVVSAFCYHYFEMPMMELRDR